MYTNEIAKHTKDPDILRSILERGNYDDISRNAAMNPNCPPDALAKVLSGGKHYYLSCYAVANPNCPPEILALALGRGKDDLLSHYAAYNPNCPSQAIIEWFYGTGKIKKYNPKKHKITPSKNKDIEELDGLMDFAN